MFSNKIPTPSISIPSTIPISILVTYILKKMSTATVSPQMRDFDTIYTTNGDCEDVIRSVRRSIKGVEKTLRNVSLGKFP